MQQLRINRKVSISQSRVRCALATMLGVLVLGTATTDALACAACGCSVSQDWTAQGVTTTPGFSGDLSYSYLNQDQARYYSGSASPALINRQYAAGQEYELYTKTQTVTAGLYYVGDTWNLVAQVPYLWRSHGTDGTTLNGGLDMGANFTSSSASGIGDIRLTGIYKGWSEKRNGGLIVGAKLPTGDTNQKFNFGAGAGTPLDPGLQIGTGSTDMIFGGFYSGSISYYGWFVQGTVQRAVNTRNDAAGNYYRPGDIYSLNTGIRYAVFGARLSPMLQFNVTKKMNDTGPDVPADPTTGALVTGGTLAYLAPGLMYRAGDGMMVYGFVQLPVYQYVNSLQLTPRYTVTLGVHQTL